MADSRFYTNAGPFTLAQIASWTETKLHNASAAETKVEDVMPLERAGKTQLSFFDNPKYLEQFQKSNAGACFVRSKFADQAPATMALLLTEDPYRCYALVAQRFYPTKTLAAEIAPTAVIAASARLGAHCRVEAGAVIGENVEIGTGVVIGANTVIGNGVVIGDNSQIGANCTLSHSILGRRVILHRGVHLGQDGFGFALGKGGPVKVPQLGRVMVEDEVEIGSGTCIDRGTGPDTMIGAGCKIDNLVQIGHNVVLGKGCVVVAQVGIAGSTRIGEGSVIAGQAGIAGHLKIGAGAKIAAQSGVMTDIPPATAFGGSPAVPVKEWHRQTLALEKMGKLHKNGGESA